MTEQTEERLVTAVEKLENAIGACAIGIVTLVLVLIAHWWFL